MKIQAIVMITFFSLALGVMLFVPSLTAAEDMNRKNVNLEKERLVQKLEYYKNKCPNDYNKDPGSPSVNQKRAALQRMKCAGSYEIVAHKLNSLMSDPDSYFK